METESLLSNSKLFIPLRLYLQDTLSYAIQAFAFAGFVISLAGRGETRAKMGRVLCGNSFGTKEVKFCGALLGTTEQS